ncbi:MAG TPA: 2-C-methyl-D-erythritol 4-phosphate cytidylyltransferase [Longimicrobiales bacterium]
MKVGVIIPAAGSGARMGGIRKPFLQLAGKPLLQHCLAAFSQVADIDNIIVALPEDVIADPPAWLRSANVSLVAGGAQRADSVRAGLHALPDDIDVVVIHDAARPLVTPEMIRAVIAQAGQGASATIAVPVTDTLHRVDEQGTIVETPARSLFWRAQTPQAFPREALELAFARTEDASNATDEAGLVAAAGYTVRVVPGDVANLKITTSADLTVAEAALATRTP